MPCRPRVGSVLGADGIARPQEAKDVQGARREVGVRVAADVEPVAAGRSHDHPQPFTRVAQPGEVHPVHGLARGRVRPDRPRDRVSLEEPPAAGVLDVERQRCRLDRENGRHLRRPGRDQPGLVDPHGWPVRLRRRRRERLPRHAAHDRRRRYSGLVISAIVLINAEVDRIPEVAQAIAELDGVSEVYSVAGDADLIAMIRVREHEQLNDVIADRLNKVAGRHRHQHPHRVPHLLHARPRGRLQPRPRRRLTARSPASPGTRPRATASAARPI